MYIEQCPCCGCVADFHSVPYDRNPSEDKWAYNCFMGKTLAVCPSCGSYFVREQISDSELNTFYSSLYQGASVATANMSVLYEFYSRFFSQVLFLKTHVNLFDGIRILEIGPNQVSVLPAISLFCKPKYCYFEQHEFPIIKNYGGKRLGQYFSHEYFENKAKVDKFNLVFMSHSLEHVNPVGLRDTIKSLHAALEDNGYLFIEVPDQIGGDKPPPHTLFFTIKGLEELLRNEGFRVTGMQSIEGKPSIRSELKPSDVQAVKGNKPFLSSFIWKCIRLCVINRFTMVTLRPVLLRLMLQKRIKELGVPYNQISYLRVVAKKSG